MRWALLLLTACSSTPDAAACKKVADKLAEIWAAPRAAGAVPAELGKASEAWRVWLKDKDPNRPAILEMCQTKMSEDQAACVTSAKDEKALAACFAP